MAKSAPKYTAIVQTVVSIDEKGAEIDKLYNHLTSQLFALRIKSEPALDESARLVAYLQETVKASDYTVHDRNLYFTVKNLLICKLSGTQKVTYTKQKSDTPITKPANKITKRSEAQKAAKVIRADAGGSDGRVSGNKAPAKKGAKTPQASVTPQTAVKEIGWSVAIKGAMQNAESRGNFVKGVIANKTLFIKAMQSAGYDITIKAQTLKATPAKQASKPAPADKPAPAKQASKAA